MTVMRKVEGHKGSLQYMVTDVRDGRIADLRANNFISLKVFDYFIGNRDRQAHNVLYSPEMNRLIAIDNGGGFRIDHECGSPKEILDYLKHDHRLAKAVYNLNKHEVEKRLKKYLSSEIIQSILNRILTIQSLHI